MGSRADITPAGLRAAEEKMRGAGVPGPAIATFRAQWEQLARGEDGLIADAEVEPLGDVPHLDDLPDEADRETLDRVVVLKLNGGLGTGMGLRQAKSLVVAREGISFLDVIVRQVLALRRRTGARLPLVLMNSFATREDTLAALARHPELPADVPADFLQNREPKLRAADLAPVEWPADRALEWCPPGHGDLYPALWGSGMLDLLLERGYRWAFVSNSDNLGAVLEPRILAWLAAGRIPFAMEATRRTEADRKGGHPARRRVGGLVQRETAQTPEGELGALPRFPIVNTNNLWIDLERLAALLAEREGVLGLPLIVNHKTVDPADPSSTEVVQLETAMGAAIGAFPDARVLEVPRARFAPVKTTEDLLPLRSDVYALEADGRVVPVRGPDALPPFVELDKRYYKLLAGFDARFPRGVPSLVDCERFAVSGDVHFGAGVVARGAVTVAHDGPGPLHVPDGTVLTSP